MDTGTGYTDRALKGLREKGFKITLQRTAILKYLDGNTSHPSVDDIYRDVLREFPGMSLATVYNTLETLEQINEIQVLCFDSSRRYYDPDTSSHHHAFCEKCKCIKDVFVDYSDAVVLPEDVSSSFLAEQTSVFFKGKCSQCASSD